MEKEIINPEMIIENSKQQSLYVNNVNIVSSYCDFQFKFGNNTIDVINNQVNNKEIVTLEMSPQHAKVMSILLQRQIQKYEEQNGQLKVPDIYE